LKLLWQRHLPLVHVRLTLAAATQPAKWVMPFLLP
jgi:hypothetical protein